MAPSDLGTPVDLVVVVLVSWTFWYQVHMLVVLQRSKPGGNARICWSKWWYWLMVVEVVVVVLELVEQIQTDLVVNGGHGGAGVGEQSQDQDRSITIGADGGPGSGVAATGWVCRWYLRWWTGGTGGGGGHCWRRNP